MTTHYLPKIATMEQAQAWLEHETGQQWTLARLIEETGIMPWVWLDYSPEFPALFAGRLEGYLAAMLFFGDVQRLAAGAGDVVITMTETADGQLVQLAGMRCPLSELRFKREDLEENASIANTPTAPNIAQSTTVPSGASESAEPEGLANGHQEHPEPPLNFGMNPRADYKTWVAWQAKKLVSSVDKRDTLAKRIRDIAVERGYFSEQIEHLAVGSFVKMIPKETTGTRAKNGRKKFTK